MVSINITEKLNINIAKALEINDYTTIEAPSSQRNSKRALHIHKMIGNRSTSARGRKEKTQNEIEEDERSEYKRRVFADHEASTRSASTSSFKAKNVKRLSEKSIRESKVAVDTFEYEVEAFNDEMKEVIKRETARLELEEKIKENAGQPLDYFLPMAQLTSSPKRISR